VNGYRVELGEIEGALRSHPDVREAAVLMKDVSHLVAYVAPRTVDPAQLREHLAARLPRYMVPSTLTLMERLPLTPNGKIDRQALANQRSDKDMSRRTLVEPRSGTEKALAAIWSELLQVERVSVDDDVFDLGAHSLMAMKALAQIRDAFGVSLSLRNLFEHPTVAGLAQIVDEMWLTKTKPAAGGEREEIVL
jgi:acyl carrier protein